MLSFRSPTTQSDGTGPVAGDIWLDPDDTENFLFIPSGVVQSWVKIDGTDPSYPEGNHLCRSDSPKSSLDADVPAQTVHQQVCLDLTNVFSR